MVNTLTELEVWLGEMRSAAEHAAGRWADRDPAQANHFAGMAVAYGQVLAQIARSRGPFAAQRKADDIPEGPHRVSFEEPETLENE